MIGFVNVWFKRLKVFSDNFHIGNWHNLLLEMRIADSITGLEKIKRNIPKIFHTHLWPFKYAGLLVLDYLFFFRFFWLVFLVFGNGGGWKRRFKSSLRDIPLRADSFKVGGTGPCYNTSRIRHFK